jgi:hypothetical protein
MKKRLVLLALLAVAGCATPAVNQKPTDPIFVPSTVQVPVPERCHVELPPEPAWAVDALLPGASPFDRSKAVLAEVEQRRDYENQLKAAATKCE